jgi:hypothetical protein
MLHGRMPFNECWRVSGLFSEAETMCVVPGLSRFRPQKEFARSKDLLLTARRIFLKTMAAES